MTDRFVSSGRVPMHPSQTTGLKSTALRSPSAPRRETMRAWLLPTLLVFVALLLTASGALASPRRPVAGVPVLGGRPVERFVLERWIVGGKERGYRPGTVVYNVKVPPNIFAPTIEDDAGVFYQAANPFQVVDTVVIGGIYVKKAQPDQIYLFFGNAEGTGINVSISPKPLPPEIVRKLRVAKVQRK